MALELPGTTSWITTTELQGRCCRWRDLSSLDDDEEALVDPQLESRERRRSRMRRVPDTDEDLDQGACVSAGLDVFLDRTRTREAEELDLGVEVRPLGGDSEVSRILLVASVVVRPFEEDLEREISDRESSLARLLSNTRIGVVSVGGGI